MEQNRIEDGISAEAVESAIENIAFLMKEIKRTESWSATEIRIRTFESNASCESDPRPRRDAAAKYWPRYGVIALHGCAATGSLCRAAASV